MKRFLLMSFTFFLVISLTGCGQNDIETDISEVSDFNYEVAVSQAIEQLVFSSVEELLSSYRAVITGDADGYLAYLAEKVNFTELERLYLPISIPEGYEIYKITINERTVSFYYLHKEDLVSEHAFLSANVQQRDFQFNFTRWGTDSPMEGVLRQNNATKRDLISGKYFFKEPNSITWSSDRYILFMYTPHPSRNYKRLGIAGSARRTAEHNAAKLAAEQDNFIALFEGGIATFSAQDIDMFGISMLEEQGYVFEVTARDIAKMAEQGVIFGLTEHNVDTLEDQGVIFEVTERGVAELVEVDTARLADRDAARSADRRADRSATVLERYVDGMAMQGNVYGVKETEPGFFMLTDPGIRLGTGQVVIDALIQFTEVEVVNLLDLKHSTDTLGDNENINGNYDIP